MVHSLIGEDTPTIQTVLLEKIQHYFQSVNSVIGQINSSMTWSLALMAVEWILSVVENEIFCAFINNVIPCSGCSYLSIGTCHDNRHTFPDLNVPCTWHNYNSRTTPHRIWWVSAVNMVFLIRHFQICMTRRGGLLSCPQYTMTSPPLQISSIQTNN